MAAKRATCQNSPLTVGAINHLRDAVEVSQAKSELAMTLIEMTAQLAHIGNGLWVGTIPAPNRYGSMELVLGGTAEAPKAEHVAAIEAFMPNALETIRRLHGRLSFSFLWDPVRIAVNNQNRGRRSVPAPVLLPARDPV